MTHEFLWLSGSNDSWLTQSIEVYEEKISHFCDFKTTKISSKNFDRTDSAQKIKAEEKEILKKISEKYFLVLFDERAKDCDSLQFAKFLSNGIESGKAKMLFLIGGAFGVSDAVRERAHLKIKLSSLTLSHQVAVVVALEQIYRGWSIREGRPYHNV